MNKIIKIEIRNENDLYDKYNSTKVSHELINYILENSYPFYNADKIFIEVENYLGNDIDCKNLIEEGLKEEMNNSLRRHQKNNMSQALYFVLGIITLFISTLVKAGILRELIVIGGWVFIWELVEVELSSEAVGMKKRRMIKKLLKTPIIERKNK